MARSHENMMHFTKGCINTCVAPHRAKNNKDFEKYNKDLERAQKTNKYFERAKLRRIIKQIYIT